MGLVLSDLPGEAAGRPLESVSSSALSVPKQAAESRMGLISGKGFKKELSFRGTKSIIF